LAFKVSTNPGMESLIPLIIHLKIVESLSKKEIPRFLNYALHIKNLSVSSEME
jgi:hypothetical protein